MWNHFFDLLSNTLDNGLWFDGSIFEPFQNICFSFAILQGSRKLLYATERMHSSLIGLAKIRVPSFKNFPEIWSIPLAFVTSKIFNNLYKASLIVETNWNFQTLQVFHNNHRHNIIIAYRFGSLGSFSNNFLPDLNKKNLKLSWYPFLLDFLKSTSHISAWFVRYTKIFQVFRSF